jgi:hypothetical protein
VTGGRWSRPRRWRRLLVGVALALASGVGVARAANTPKQAEPFRLVWSSSAGCASARTFLTELERRTALLREARADEHAITLIVETFRTEGGVRGQLTVRKPDGDLTVREVPGQHCQEVESAMALIAALMVDPLAGDPERASVQRLQPAESSPPSPTSASASAWSLRLEQRLTARTAVAPDLTWGQALGAMLTRETGRARPSLGLSAHRAQATTSAAQGSAELEWAAAQLTLCPLGMRPSQSWDVRACAALQLGRLRGVGFETAEPAAKSIFWSSVGVELEGRYQLLGPLWLGWEGAFTLPFSRERFYLEPQQTLHRVPAWGLSFGVGLGLRFF